MLYSMSALIPLTTFYAQTFCNIWDIRIFVLLLQ